jgi:hypothetical protein
MSKPFVIEVVAESELFKVKNTKIGNKKATTLTMSQEGFDKIKHLFESHDGASTSRMPVLLGNIEGVTKNLRGLGDGGLWEIRALKKGFGGMNEYSIYGVSGDYTFGHGPSYHRLQLNRIKPAKAFFKDFIEKLK